MASNKNPAICSAHLVPTNHCALLHRQWPDVSYEDLMGDDRDLSHLNRLYAEFSSGDLMADEMPDLINELVRYGYLLPVAE